jgi:hypothetical protein
LPTAPAPNKSLPLGVHAPGKGPTLWENKWFGDKIGQEMAKAAELGVQPIKITSPASVAEIGADGRVFKWVVSREGELLGLPKLNKGDVFKNNVINDDDVIKHSVATGGRPVQAAGNARLMGDKVLIDRRSGHYRPDEASLQIAKQRFEAAGFKVEIVEGVE